MCWDFDKVSTVGCIFETILHHVALRHNDNDVIIYSNGDMVFATSKLHAILSFVFCHPDTSKKKDEIGGQRRDTPLMDDDGAEIKLLEGGLLTADSFHQFYCRSLIAGVLYAFF